MSRWSFGSHEANVQHENDSEVVLDPPKSVPAAKGIDLWAEEERMPLEQSSDEFMNKLVDEIRHGLKPDFDAVNARIDTANSGIASLTTNVADQAKVTMLRFDSLDQRFGALGDSLNAIKKHLGI